MARVEDRFPTVFHKRAAKADGLFRLGKNTCEIARALNVREHYAQKLVTVGRSIRLGLPVPYDRE